MRLSTIRSLFIAALIFSALLVCAQPDKISYEELKKKYVPQSTPYASVRLELELLSQGMYCYDLPLFDAAWRGRGKKVLFNSRYKQTAQKFDVLYKVYREGKYAIVYYPYNKETGPDFLFRTNSGWVIDRTSVWDYIHYNRTNSGWFAYEGDYPYLKIFVQFVYSGN